MRARDEATTLAATIEVNFIGLAELAATLQGLASEFGDRNGSLQAELGDPDLAAAFGRVERDWSEQRRRLHTFLDDAEQSVQSALACYRQLEADLATSLDFAAVHR